jgi:AraC-like DNA-binding protein
LKISFTRIEGFENLACAMTEVQIHEALDPSISALLAQVCDRLKADDADTDRSAFLFGALLILLSSLTGGEKKSGDGSRDRLIAATLRYIDSNISKPLDADSIAGALSVSPSTLTHSFKQEMGISLHKYVTQKRVALAQRLIAGGSIPTKVYADCGYGDYSSFYKAYFKILGHSPSHSGLNDL